MGLPEQVRRQAERANELLNQANEPPANPDAPAPTEPVVTEPQVELPTEPQAAQQPPAQPAEPPAATEPAPAENWEHKYRTLQGVFNAESGRWQAEKKVFETRLQALENQAPKAPSPEPVAPTKAKRITDQDLETYGSELLDVIERKAADIADELVAQRMAELKPELDKTRDQVTSVAGQVYQNAQQRFYGELAKEVPDWEAVNADSRFLSWLGEIDPLSGVPRQAYLDNASQNLDHTRVATLFNTFKDKAGLNKPTAPAPAKPTLSPSPRTVGTASAPTPREPQTGVRRTEIAAHYRRASTDATYRTSADHQAMEQRIAQAMATDTIIEA